MKQVGPFQCTKPCSSCPYRTDAPLQLWDKQEFVTLLENERDYLGRTYGCHKKNGSTCIGWLMDQNRRDFPCIMLRVALSVNNVSRQYLDSLRSPAPLYSSVIEMVKANYPELVDAPS